MAGISPFFNTFNRGVDLTITITADTPIAGVPSSVKLDGKRRMFEMQADDILMKDDNCDNGGVPSFQVQPDGWTGRIEVEKQTNAFSQLYGFLEQNRIAGGLQQTFTIVETVRAVQPGASNERNRYMGCVFHKYKPGSWQKKNITTATVEVAASQRIPM